MYCLSVKATNQRIALVIVQREQQRALELGKKGEKREMVVEAAKRHLPAISAFDTEATAEKVKITFSPLISNFCSFWTSTAQRRVKFSFESCVVLLLPMHYQTHFVERVCGLRG